MRPSFSFNLIRILFFFSFIFPFHFVRCNLANECVHLFLVSFFMLLMLHNESNNSYADTKYTHVYSWPIKKNENVKNKNGEKCSISFDENVVRCFKAMYVFLFSVTVVDQFLHFIHSFSQNQKGIYSKCLKSILALWNIVLRQKHNYLFEIIHFHFKKACLFLVFFTLNLKWSFNSIESLLFCYILICIQQIFCCLLKKLNLWWVFLSFYFTFEFSCIFCLCYLFRFLFLQISTFEMNKCKCSK